MGKSIFGRKQRGKRRLARDANQTDRAGRGAALKYVTRHRSDMTGGPLSASQFGLPQTAGPCLENAQLCVSEMAAIKIPRLHIRLARKELLRRKFHISAIFLKINFR